MVLVYNSTSQKWEGTLDLTPGSTQNLDINGGTFKWRVLLGSRDPLEQQNQRFTMG